LTTGKTLGYNYNEGGFKISIKYPEGLPFVADNTIGYTLGI
jgi:hypothetical protein